jgi:hypothetical protein
MRQADTDPAITDAPVRFDGTTVADDLRDEFGDFSRASQEQQLQRLNEAVYSTYCDVAIEPECKTDAARRLIEHWYDVEDGVFTTAFDDSGAPEGWRAGDVVDTPTTDDPNLQTVNPPEAEIIYQLVYAFRGFFSIRHVPEIHGRAFQQEAGYCSNGLPGRCHACGSPHGRPLLDSE